MTAPAPAITKVALNVHVDQDEPGTVTMSMLSLGTNPFVVVQMDARDEALVLDVEIGGREMSMKSIGDALEMIAKTLQGKGDSLTAQAKESGETVSFTGKASEFFTEPVEAAETESVDERKCTCDGGAYFTAEQNASRHPFLVSEGCPFHGKDAKGGAR